MRRRRSYAPRNAEARAAYFARMKQEREAAQANKADNAGAPFETIKAIPSPVKSGAKEASLVMDLPQFAALAARCDKMPEARNMPSSFTGGRFGYAKAVECILKGDNAGVAESDKYLRELEDKMPAAFASGWTVRDNVTGAVPNVPAYIQGNPYNMRLRHRIASEMAPLTVYADLTISAGVRASDLQKRGACILALVRALASRRPVELYAVSGAGNSQTCCYIIVRIDTAPLDLARAAHVLTSAAVYRGVTFAMIRKIHDDGTLPGHWGGQWAYNDSYLYRDTTRERLMQITGASEGFYISAAHVNDPLVSKPLQWLQEKVREYGGAGADDLAA